MSTKARSRTTLTLSALALALATGAVASPENPPATSPAEIEFPDSREIEVYGELDTDGNCQIDMVTQRAAEGEVEGEVEAVPFEEVRDELLRELTGTARERAYSDLVGQVVDQAYRDPNSLEPAAATGGVEVQTAGPFSRSSCLTVMRICMCLTSVRLLPL